MNWRLLFQQLDKTVSEHQRQQVTPDWVISRHQIQLTDKLLGMGGWGSVVEGKYCGCSVAVKQIHNLILSPRYRTLFEREMDIASRCRHPCLLQFIGATNDEGSPLFVTELMESSFTSTVGAKTSCSNGSLHYFFRCGSSNKLPSPKGTSNYSP